jgi:alkylation response protein AidB-like acyl-CoA dehydrogenase
MDFSLNEEQQQLKDGLQRYLERSYGFEARRRQLKSGEHFSESHWSAFADMGLLGIGVPEALGGMGPLGDGAEGTWLVMECFGRSLVLEPYLATVVLCGSVLRASGTPAQQATLFPGIVAGSKVLALAVHERDGRHLPSHVAASARRQADGYVLNGAKFAVLQGDAAHTLIVSARTGGSMGDQEGISLFMVDKGAAGLAVRGYGTYDGTRAAEVTLQDVHVPATALLGAEGAAHVAIEYAVGHGLLALCAEAVGAMEALCEQTLAYLKTRKQFGVPIGSFQALQHRMVDMFMALEQARSITMLAAIKAESPDTTERARVLAAAKSLVGQAARKVGQEAVQLHGGMGVTDEMPVSHYFKRLTAIDITLGDAAHHRGALGDLLANAAA